jgi:2-polyprenyl-6-methoxyphenol hydroxylase-like FAD-dependent oxidoreductase
VNLAVQDAVATANQLAAKLATGCPSDDELDRVRRRREFPVRMTQRMQAVVQNNLISMALAPGNRPLRVPRLVRLITAVPWFQGITARFVGLGVRPEHVRSPVAHSPASMSFRWQQSLRRWPSAPRLPDQHQTER